MLLCCGSPQTVLLCSLVLYTLDFGTSMSRPVLLTQAHMSFKCHGQEGPSPSRQLPQSGILDLDEFRESPAALHQSQQNKESAASELQSATKELPKTSALPPSTVSCLPVLKPQAKESLPMMLCSLRGSKFGQLTLSLQWPISPFIKQRKQSLSSRPVWGDERHAQEPTTRCSVHRHPRNLGLLPSPVRCECV